MSERKILATGFVVHPVRPGSSSGDSLKFEIYWDDSLRMPVLEVTAATDLGIGGSVRFRLPPGGLATLGDVIQGAVAVLPPEPPFSHHRSES